MSIQQLLKQYFGYESFRPLQETVIRHVMEGRDGLVLMPTGGGKSLCYQIPALALEGMALVISPLIALMKDQVEALRSSGVKASFINSSLSQQEQDAVLWAARMGELKLLYIAPERLFFGGTSDFLRKLKINLIAIDESHCISSWGHDFRPEYRQLSALKTYFPGAPVVALTATADKVTRKDICRQLGIVEENVFLSGFDRPNISLEVAPGRDRNRQILDFISGVPDQAGIIYCLSRNGTESLATVLAGQGIRAGHYHAGMDPQSRSRVQEAFLKDDIQVVVATIAFGMGIDKSNVRWVIHYNLPGNIESFYQEIGRAGRDGAKASTLLFFSYGDVIHRRKMIGDSGMPEDQKLLMVAKLERMQQYAEAQICRRRILLSYFNEETEKDCGNCDVCLHPRKRFDATIPAQKVLSAIARTGQNAASGLLIDILRGSRNQQVVKAGYDQLPTFGAGRDLRYEEWVDYLAQMLNLGIMDIAYDEGYALKLNARSWQVLKNGDKVELAGFVSFEERRSREKETLKNRRAAAPENDLFIRLKRLRKQVADALAIAPYMVFHDTTLQEMASYKPMSMSEMMEIQGVGAEKYRRYGETFISEIRAYVSGGTVADRKVEKGRTFLETFERYEKGFSVEEIAEQRGLNYTTIMQHLIRLYEEGRNVDLMKFTDQSTFLKISDFVSASAELQGVPAKAIFEHFEGGIPYEEIRIALALLKRQRGTEKI